MDCTYENSGLSTSQQTNEMLVANAHTHAQA